MLCCIALLTKLKHVRMIIGCFNWSLWLTSLTWEFSHIISTYISKWYTKYIYLHIYCRCIDSVCIHIKLHNTTTISSLNYLVIGIMKISYTWSPITRTLGSPLIRHRLISSWYRLISNRRLSESLKPGLPRPSALGNECKKKQFVYVITFTENINPSNTFH